MVVIIINISNSKLINLFSKFKYNFFNQITFNNLINKFDNMSFVAKFISSTFFTTKLTHSDKLIDKVNNWTIITKLINKLINPALIINLTNSIRNQVYTRKLRRKLLTNNRMFSINFSNWFNKQGIHIDEFSNQKLPIKFIIFIIRTTDKFFKRFITKSSNFNLITILFMNIFFIFFTNIDIFSCFFT